MKKFLLFVSFLALLSVAAAAQNDRYDAPFPSVTSQYATPFLVANVPPNSPLLSVCHSPANQVPCTNYATTYNSLGVACANGSQDTPQPQPSSCQPTGDAQGNIGFWAPQGTYDYTVCIAGTISCFGPYTVTLGSASASGVDLQTNGTPNASQSLLNLVESNGINPVDDGAGAVELDLLIQDFATGCLLIGQGGANNGAVDCSPVGSFNGTYNALQGTFLAGPTDSYKWQGTVTGSGSISAQANAGSPTNLLWPSGAGGTLVDSATSPIVADPVTGNISCPTCSTSGTDLPLTGGTLSGTLNTNSQIVSTLATGTAPLVVASTTNVANLNASSLNGATFAAPGAIGGTTPAAGSFTAAKYSTLATTTKCAAGGTAANPSVVSCSAAPAGIVYCDVMATGPTGTCQINTTAVTANSVISVTPSTAENTLLSVTCNAAPSAVPAVILASKNAGVSFTINMPTVTVNGSCFEYSIIN